MVSLWGSKKNDGEQNGSESNTPRASSSDGERPRSSRRSNREDADERTRLLPREEGYLSPDDPAVSPYNLFSVRAIRFFSVVFLMLSFLWWVLLLVSIFVSPPYFNSRGSGYTDFAFTTLTVGNLIVGLLFFAFPSASMEILSLVISVLIIADMIIIVAVGRLRVEEGWIGIASVVWAALMGLYNVLSNRTVQWGKKEEEERLTGRQETRRTLREWCAVLTSTVLMIVLVLVTILLTATLSLRARDATLKPPGQRYYVDGDKYQIHVHCIGNQTYDTDRNRLPTVLLEAGEMPVEDTMEDWVYDAHQNGTIDRYCYYDRPGMGWSDNAPSPHSAGMTADALSEALAVMGERGPWVLVSHGIGGVYSRVFSSRHVRDVRGIFLIDAVHEDLLYKVGNPGRGFVLWGRGVISPLGFDRLSGALFKGRKREDRVYGKSAYQGGKFLKQQLQENLVANSLTKNEVVSARNIQTRNTPLVIVTSGTHAGKDKEWQRKQEDLTKVTDNLVAWDVVNKAPHEVWRTLDGRQVLEQRLGQLFTGIW